MCVGEKVMSVLFLRNFQSDMINLGSYLLFMSENQHSYGEQRGHTLDETIILYCLKSTTFKFNRKTENKEYKYAYKTTKYSGTSK